jgi:hypothetical protein
MAEAAVSERKFGLTVGGAFLLFGLLALWREHPTAAAALGAPGVLLILGALLAPSWLAPVQRYWMAVGMVLGAFWSRVLLGLFYYVVVSPVGLVMRLVGRDPLDQRLRTGESYWRKRPPEPEASRGRYARLS